jgi:hypothetical protein
VAIKSCPGATGGFVRGGFVNCNSANTAASAAKIHFNHFNIFFIPFHQTQKQ